MNSIVFGGINSSTYGIYISGEGVWNAPERDAETIQIPGRNGEYVLDKGSFKNIEVTYPAFNQETSYNDFRTKVDNFRNAISSLKGYQRLTDSFHPDEYRMAAFIGGLEVKPVLYNDKSMEMNITFNCKPQRFLTSGETQQTVTSGATITNPTLFESHPLLLVDGYGTLNINGEPITIQQGAVMGSTDITFTQQNSVSIANASITSNLTMLTDVSNIALQYDPIYMGNIVTRADGMSSGVVEAFNFTSGTNDTFFRISPSFTQRSLYISVTFRPSYINFAVGVSKNTTQTLSANYEATIGGQTVTGTIDFEAVCTYNAQNTFTFAIKTTFDSNFTAERGTYAEVTTTSRVNSTKSALGQLYIDLDIGECYRIENGQYISINTATILPADLPTLKPGTNTITYDNTFTSFKVTPRWWKV